MHSINVGSKLRTRIVIRRLGDIASGNLVTVSDWGKYVLRRL